MALRAEADPGGCGPGPRSAPRPRRDGARRLRHRPGARVSSDLRGGIAARRAAGRRAGAVRTVERLVAVTRRRRRQPRWSARTGRSRGGEPRGFDRLLAEHRAAWAQRWEAVDVRIPDDPARSGRAVRAVPAVVQHRRTTSWRSVPADCPASGYAGHVFWDADVFVLPALAAIDPAAARRDGPLPPAPAGRRRGRARAARAAPAPASRGSRRPPATTSPRRASAIGAEPDAGADRPARRSTSPPTSPGRPCTTRSGPDAACSPGRASCELLLRDGAVLGLPLPHGRRRAAPYRRRDRPG